MYKRNSIYSKSGKIYRLLHLLIIAGIVGFGILVFITQKQVALADGPGGDVTDPVVRAVDIAKPAVVRIITTIGGRLTVQFNSGSVTFPLNDPGGYPIQLSGTGTFISAHGDILTADHVVNPPHDQQIDQYLDDTATPDVTNYINQHSTQQVTENQVNQELYSGQIPSTTSYSQPTSEVFLSTDYTGPLSATSFSNIPDYIHASVDRIEKESSFNQKDVAIIHVAMNDMPSVQLGDSANVQQQDELTIIGFPGNGDVSSKPTDLLTVSVNKIFVSSIKSTDSGAPVIQVGGNVEHGDSGGPALDKSGAIVGIVSFGSSGPGSTSFLQASSSARELVTALNLDTTPGTFQKIWSQAFTDYAATTAGHWHKAAQEFTSLVSAYPNFKAITPYLTYANQQAGQEQQPQQTPTSSGSNPTAPTTTTAGSNWLLILVGVGIILLVGIIITGVVASNRTRRKSASVPVMTQAVQTPRPPFMQQQQLPPQRVPASTLEDAMTAFGAPATPSSVPRQPGNSDVLRPWPCGHMNRSNARFCSVCGEPAPQPPTVRRIEQ